MSLTIFTLMIALLCASVAITTGFLTQGRTTKEVPLMYSTIWITVILTFVFGITSMFSLSDNERAQREYTEHATTQACVDAGGVVAFETCLKPGFEEIRIP